MEGGSDDGESAGGMSGVSRRTDQEQAGNGLAFALRAELVG